MAWYGLLNLWSCSARHWQIQHDTLLSGTKFQGQILKYEFSPTDFVTVDIQTFDAWFAQWALTSNQAPSRDPQFSNHKQSLNRAASGMQPPSDLGSRRCQFATLLCQIATALDDKNRQSDTSNSCEIYRYMYIHTCIYFCVYVCIQNRDHTHIHHMYTHYCTTDDI